MHERKTNYIFNLISNNTDIKHDTCCWHNIEHDCYHAWYVLLEQHCSRLLVHLSPEQCCFTPVDNLQQVVRFCVFTRVNHPTVEIYRVSGHYNEKNNLLTPSFFSHFFERPSSPVIIEVSGVSQLTNMCAEVSFKKIWNSRLHFEKRRLSPERRSWAMPSGKFVKFFSLIWYFRPLEQYFSFKWMYFHR